MTKKKLYESCAMILNKYPLNSILNNQIEIEFLLDVFKNHPDWNIKKGNGIDSIAIKSSPNHNTKCFYLNRLDGTGTDISIRQSISPTGIDFDIKQACRYSVESFIIDFKRKTFINGVTKCAITNEVLEHDNVHVDHYDLTFNEVFNKWIIDQDTDTLKKSLNDTKKDNSSRIYFTNEDIKQSFITFHNSNTNLRLVTVRANLSRNKTYNNR